MSDSTTLATLQEALKPKTGMRRISLPLESYQHQSPPLSSKRLLNMMAEKEPGDARTVAALLPTPGIYGWQSIGSGPILAMNDDLPGYLYVVSGDHLWRVGRPIAEGGAADLGYVGTAVAAGNRHPMVTIAVGVTSVVVCVPPNAYVTDHAGTLVTQITGDFPGASSVAYLDGYFVWTTYEEFSAKFFVSRLLDPATVDALDFAYADAVVNVLDRVIVHRGEIWLTGRAGIEIWYDAGTADFPFRRQAGGVINIGSASARSIARGNGSVWWVGTDDIVYRSAGYQRQRVSTHAIEEILRAKSHDPPGDDTTGGPSNVDGGLFYIQEGHSFYVFTTGDQTLAYDCATQAWHDRSSDPNGNGRWAPNSVAIAAGIPEFGHYANGSLLLGDRTIDTDQGNLVMRQITLPPLWAGTNRAFCARLEIEMEVGGATPPGDVILEWSDDGGYTWPGGPRVMSGGTVPGFRGRVFTTRLGSFRQRIFRITTHHLTTIYAVDADIVPGVGG